MQIILASASERRRALLKRRIPAFRVIKPDVHEKFPESNISPYQYVCDLAVKKAESVAGKIKSGLVIGADTIVYSKGKFIGKPKNLNSAKKILRALSGTRHSVITGVCVINKKNNLALGGYSETVVYMKKLSPERMAELLKSYKHYDKAGGYAIQEQGDPYIKIIKGRVDNAVGLPLDLVCRLIKKASLCKN
ncbi:MAG: septum formation protein Maf [Planctomycetes bacterium]|nr:septum formation protein Maf [Planctomycetota bacterium]